MKILIGTSTPFHLGHLARELTFLGHDVTMIGYMPKRGTNRFFNKRVKYKSFFFLTLPLSFFALQNISIWLKRKSIFWMMPIIDWIISLYIKDQDVFIGLSGVCLRSYAKARKKGVLTFCDRGSSHVLDQMQEINNSIKNTFPKLYIDRELEGYKISDYITVPSIFSKSTFLKNNIKKQRLFLNNYGVDLQYFELIEGLDDKINTRKINVIYVGAWSYRKGCDLLIEALAKLENLNLTHIGNKVDLDFPESERFNSLGVIPNEKLSNYLSNNDVFVLASREDGFGMVLLEALASGLPIIASTNSGGPDIKAVVGDKKIVQIFESGNVEQLIELLSNIEKNKFDKNAVNDFSVVREHFSWSSYGRRYSDFIENII